SRRRARPGETRFLVHGRGRCRRLRDGAWTPRGPGVHRRRDTRPVGGADPRREDVPRRGRPGPGGGRNRVARTLRPRASWTPPAGRLGQQAAGPAAPPRGRRRLMDTAEIRRRFVAHFERAAHPAVPSASLLLDDPNLLFVNAGMVPFKPYFLGQETPPYIRAVSVQKCIRTPDIEDVGKTTRHGTFFEMCGNFSFGDYFKEGAVEYAWDLVTKPQAEGGFGLEESRLWPSILHGDDEALQVWMRVTGLPSERIVKLGPREN